MLEGQSPLKHHQSMLKNVICTLCQVIFSRFVWFRCQLHALLLWMQVFCYLQQTDKWIDVHTNYADVLEIYKCNVFSVWLSEYALNNKFILLRIKRLRLTDTKTIFTFFQEETCRKINVRLFSSPHLFYQNIYIYSYLNYKSDPHLLSNKLFEILNIKTLHMFWFSSVYSAKQITPLCYQYTS